MNDDKKKFEENLQKNYEKLQEKTSPSLPPGEPINWEPMEHTKEKKAMISAMRDELIKISAGGLPMVISGHSLMGGAAMPPRASQMMMPAAKPPARPATPPPLPAAARGGGGNEGFNALMQGAQGAKNPFQQMKLGADLTEEQRSKLPKKDFAVSAKKSNTGERAYPIPDRQHARSALGFSKMHGDTADYERVRAAVAKKFPDMVKSAMPRFVNVAPGTEHVHSDRFRSVLESLPSRTFYAEEKTASVVDSLKGLAKGDVGNHMTELAGLGILAAPSVDQLQAHARAGLAGDYSKEGVKDREMLPAIAHPAAEAAGLGVLMAPEVKQLLHARAGA